jgi:hypothetical protein
MPQAEEIGVVTSRSGTLIVIDTGYLNLWSHDRPPVLPTGSLETDEQTDRANLFIDLHIVGQDAERAGVLLDMSWHPSYVYDQPPDHPELQSKLDELVRKHKLDAHFEVISPRIPHRRRVDLALQHGKGAGEVQFHGIWTTVVGGVPTSLALRVLGVRAGADTDRWKRVVIECLPNVQPARSERVGFVGVDYARLLIADVDALAGWKHEESCDGMADYVFWGRDAERTASALNVPNLPDGEFGWLNLPVAAAEERGIAVQEYRDRSSLKFAVDFRPHSDHWRVMTPTRKSKTESASVDLAGVQICNFMTTWGDGVFEVRRDLSESGELVAIRIELEQVPLSASSQ